MEDNKIRRVTDANYKSDFYSSIYRDQSGHMRPTDILQKLQTSEYEARKPEIDRLYYSTTYQLNFGREKYSQL